MSGSLMFCFELNFRQDFERLGGEGAYLLRVYMQRPVTIAALQVRGK